jgi:pentatricopeptide repeat protein
MDTVAQTDIKLSSLPSKGKTYPSNAYISIRNFNYAEIKKISNSNLSEREGLALVLAGMNTNFDKMQITFNDFLYLGLLRKIQTLGTPKIQVPYIKPKTKEKAFHVITPDALEIEDIECDLPVKLDIDTAILEFMPLTVGDILKLNDMGKLDDQTYLMAAMCKNKSIDEAYGLIGSIMDSDILRDLGLVEEHLTKGIKPLVFDCKETYKGAEVTTKVSIRLEGRGALLLPFREQGTTSRSRISFGKGSESTSNESI